MDTSQCGFGQSGAVTSAVMNGRPVEADFPVTEQVASPRGLELALHHFGGSGPTLLVNHATGFHARCYLPMMSILTQHFDVWGADFAGHGSSEAPPDGDFRWSLFADDLLCIIDHLGVDHVRAFGHSMGGAATLLAAQKRPAAFEAAWLFEPIIFPEAVVPRNSMMAEAASKRRRVFPSKAKALMRYASRPPLGTMRADALAAYVDGGFRTTAEGDVELACAPESEAATFNNAGTGVSDIAGLDLRVTVAHGEANEEPSPAAFCGPLVEALDNSVLATYHGLGHFGPLQDPTRIATDVVAFLAD